MSRVTERAYDLIVRLGEKLGMVDVNQFFIESATTPDEVLVTTGTGGFKLVPASTLGGAQFPPPTGDYDALTIDPAGVIQWGGRVSAGEF
jgi:hypothetical protein